MDSELVNRAEAIRVRLTQLRDSLDLESKQNTLRELEDRMTRPGFWDNQERAQGVVGELKAIRMVVKPLEDALASSNDLEGLLELAGDDATALDEVRREIERLESIHAELELRALLNGPHDGAGAIMSIHARDGGTDANDWAEMLQRMYMQWAQKHEYTVEILDRVPDDVAGIQSVTMAIRGPMAYGYLKGEMGIHRLVRISPFNSEGKRQTSFAAIDVSPEIDDSIKVEINDEDVREDVFRASGAGGQHVNKTSSAIRLTHIPTGIVVQCQNERSQHKNRAFAWKMLRARMVRAEEEKREAAGAEKYKNQARTGFGSQIRNYFLHPDQRVKDARTGHSSTQFHDVLDGNIQGFLDSVLRWRVGQGEGPGDDDD
ncbi:MAG: peptide chain release factor 2 [Pirellulales bacterium]